MLTNVPPTPPAAWVTLQDEQQFAERPEIRLLEERLGAGYVGWRGFQGNLVIGVVPSAVIAALKLLKEESRYDHFSFMSCAHWPEKPGEGFQMVWQLYRRDQATWVRVETWIPDQALVHFPSVCAVYPAAEWHECEVYDLFGITFEKHPNLRRLFTPGMYDEFPLRRDFPLDGAPLRDFQQKLIAQWNDSGQSHDHTGSLADEWMDRWNS